MIAIVANCKHWLLSSLLNRDDIILVHSSLSIPFFKLPQISELISRPIYEAVIVLHAHPLYFIPACYGPKYYFYTEDVSPKQDLLDSMKKFNLNLISMSEMPIDKLIDQIKEKIKCPMKTKIKQSWKKNQSEDVSLSPRVKWMR